MFYFYLLAILLFELLLILTIVTALRIVRRLFSVFSRRDDLVRKEISHEVKQPKLTNDYKNSNEKVLVTINQKLQITDEYFHKNSNLMTGPEKNFFRTLRKVTQDKVRICPQVALSQIVSINQNKEGWRDNLIWNNVKNCVIDYVLCEKDTSKILLLIELNDESHAEPSRFRRDDAIDNLMQNLQIPLEKFPTRQNYDEEKLLSRLIKYKSVQEILVSREKEIRVQTNYSSNRRTKDSRKEVSRM
ncbi:MAG: DUF2726 domain-containing protein [bacterium]